MRIPCVAHKEEEEEEEEEEAEKEKKDHLDGRRRDAEIKFILLLDAGFNQLLDRLLLLQVQSKKIRWMDQWMD